MLNDDIKFEFILSGKHIDDKEFSVNNFAINNNKLIIPDNLDLPFNISRNEITRSLDPAFNAVDNYICKTILDDPYGPYIEPININRFNQMQVHEDGMLPVSCLVYKMTTNNFSTINDMGNLIHSSDISNEMGSYRLAYDASYYKVFECKLNNLNLIEEVY